ncbi:MAG: pilus assembly protein TadG-related protein [Chloroflexia bacterium]
MLTIFRHHRSEPPRGQTLVLFALMSLLLLAGLGLIFDAGLDYSNRRTMQNAADTAALRGARVIAQKAVYADAPDYMNGYVKTEVENAAVANGVPSAANVICEYITDALATSSCTDGPIPSGVTGVKVRVSETHTPIVMRALGVTTTGTAASSAAQVQMVKGIFGQDFPFMVCGVDTAVVGGGSFSILTTDIETDPGPAEPSPSPMDYKIAISPYTIDSGAYSYDWNVRNTNGSFYDYGGPQFVIYGSGIENCGIGDWKGLVRRSSSERDQVNLYTAQTVTEFQFAGLTAVKGSASFTAPYDDVSPNRSINGPQGCKADEIPDGCIVVLPIGDSDPWCPTQCIYSSQDDQEQYQTALKGRRWGAFYIAYDGGTGQVTGRLVKNFPMHTDGVTGWDPSYYVGPLNVTIIQTP